MDRKSYDNVIYLVEQSEINSELALQKTRTAIIRARVTELQRENEILREDFERTFGEDFR
jgi:cell shape-determining protein MreC